MFTTNHSTRYVLHYVYRSSLLGRPVARVEQDWGYGLNNRLSAERQANHINRQAGGPGIHATSIHAYVLPHRG